MTDDAGEAKRVKRTEMHHIAHLKHGAFCNIVVRCLKPTDPCHSSQAPRSSWR